MNRISLFTLLWMAMSCLPLCSQNLTFSDTLFKKVLLMDTTINTNKDKEISLQEALDTKVIRFSNQSFYNMSGINAFSNLERLIIPKNKIPNISEIATLSNLQELDISANNASVKIDLSGLSLLKILKCSSMNGVGPISFSIDVSRNLNLEVLNCARNYLNELDVSNLKKLRVLDCSMNNIKVLDIALCNELDSLDCESNLISNLDVKDKNLIRFLSCGDNQLSSLNLNKSSILEILRIQGNPITQLDLSKNTELKQLLCYMVPLEHLNLDKNSKLVNLNIGETKIKTLELSHNPLITSLYCNLNDSITDLDVSHLRLTHLSCFGCPLLNKICVRSFADVYRQSFTKSSWTVWSLCRNETCQDHITNTSACDDFKDADVSTSVIEEYSVSSDKPSWPIQEQTHAQKGLFWTGIQSTENTFTAQKERDGSGMLKYTVTQDLTSFEPFILNFGSYEENGTEKPFTLDLSNNAEVSFDLTNSEMMVEFYVHLQDIHGNRLLLDKGAYGTMPYPVGYSFNSSSLFWGDAKAYYGTGTSNFSYDFKNAICGTAAPASIQNGTVPQYYQILTPASHISFDYSQVSKVLFILCRVHYQRYEGLNSHPITLSNFRIGSYGQVSNVSDKTQEIMASETFEAYDMLGQFVGRDLEQELPLKPNTLYILKSKTHAKKVMILK